jgi:hypothetical protein
LRYLMREELIHHTGLDYYYDLEEMRPSPRRVTASRRSSKTSKG